MFGNLKNRMLFIMNKKAVVLFSGGLDSTTVLYDARAKGYDVHALIFDYGQRHCKEISLAKAIAKKAKVHLQMMKISMPWKGSSLLDKTVAIPQQGVKKGKIPSTYVPGRNIIFLSFAASYAEAIGAKTIFIGVNAIDYSGYPDCRKGFLSAFTHMLKKGLKVGVEGEGLRIEAPLLYLNKAQIIRLGRTLKVPYEKTWSCYKGGKKPCGVCDSCVLRKKGFQEAGSKDPLNAYES